MSKAMAPAQFVYDVNIFMVPSALRHAQAIMSDARFELIDKAYAERAGKYYPVWKEEAPKLFTVHVDAATARQKIRARPAPSHRPACRRRFNIIKQVSIFLDRSL